MLRVLILLTLTCGYHVTGLPDGPPDGACQMMTPGHGENVNPQTGPPPFTLTIGQAIYAPNERITVTLSGTDGTDFKGFFIQARPAGVDVWATYGTFATPSGTTNPCADVPDGISGPSNAAVSHSNADLKSSISVQWTAPASDEGDIQFLFTVVQNKTTYWVQQAGPTLSFSPTLQPTPPPTNIEDETEATEDTEEEEDEVEDESEEDNTITNGGNVIERDPRCGASLSCFPDSCDTDCNHLVTWRKLDDNDVEFTVKKHALSTGYYVAIGFSADTKMGDDSVVDCLLDSSGEVTVKSSYNKFVDGLKFNDPMTPSNYGLSNPVGTYANGILSCTFKRKITAALADAALGGRRRRATAGSDVTFNDLNSEWYLFSAWGQYNGAIKDEHSGFGRSGVKYNFLAVTDEPESTTLGLQTGVVTKKEGCGKTHGCFGECDGDICEFLFTWKPMGDDIAITMSAKRSGNTYFAVGMSRDDKMGDDSVMECTSDAGSANAYVSYNSGEDNERLDDGQFGLSGITGSHVNGLLTCSFSRKKTAALASGGSTRRKRAVTDASTFFDMGSDSDYTLAPFAQRKIRQILGSDQLGF